MIRYHFDLYPRDDPKNGVRLVRFTKLQSAEYRGEANGTGSGRFSIRADTAEAQFIDPAGLQYVRVVREDTVAATEAVVGGFFLDFGDFTALDERGTRLLTFGGAGTLSYLSRSIMASHTYISPIFTGQDPIAGVWNLWNQSTFYANGNYLGAMLWRVLYEATHFTPGTHRHADGVNVTDTHADDRPENALPDLTLGFDAFNDSNAAAWTVTSGEFKAQVGENVLQVVKRLMEAGLYVEMNPDTFELDAYPASGHRRTRTGASWGANVVRFQAPTGGDIDTGNIKSDAKRAIAAFIKRSWLLAGSNDTYGDATGTSDIPWEGFYHSDTADATALAGIAGVQTGARDDAGDTARLRIRLGTDTSNGYYRPFEDVRLDDLVTVHTGTTQWDWNEQNFPVAAITVTLREGGDWDAWVELGSSYSATPGRQFQVSPVAAHNHPPNPELCRRNNPTTPTVESSDYMSTTPGAILVPDDLTDSILVVFGWGNRLNDPPATATYGATAMTPIPDSEISASSEFAYMRGFYLLNPPADPIASGAQLSVNSTLGGGMPKGWFVLSGVDQSTPLAAVQTATASGTTPSLSIPTSAGAVYLNSFAAFTQGGNPTAAPEPDAGQTEAWSEFFDAGGGGGDYEFGGGYGDATPSWVMSGSAQPWVMVGVALHPSETGAGDSGPMPVGANDEADHGTSIRATRCDHVHPHSDLSDHPDEIHHHASSIEVTPFETVAATDLQSALEEIYDEAAGVTDHGSLTGLTDDDHNYLRDRGGGEDLVHAHGAVGATETIDPEQGNWHALTLDANLTLTLTNPAAGVGASLLLELTQDGTGGRTLTLPASVSNKSELEAAYDTTASTTSFLLLWTRDTGTTWYGAFVGGSSVGALDDLSDVTLTSPAALDRLHYNGTAWVNTAAIWRPLMDGAGNVVTDGGTGEAIMALS